MTGCLLPIVFSGKMLKNYYQDKNYNYESKSNKSNEIGFEFVHLVHLSKIENIKMDRLDRDTYSTHKKQISWSEYSMLLQGF